jgi:hypothetical protein
MKTLNNDMLAVLKGKLVVPSFDREVLTSSIVHMASEISTGLIRPIFYSNSWRKPGKPGGEFMG